MKSSLTINDAINDIETILSKVNLISSIIKFDKHNEQDLIAVSLHGSIFELTHTCKILLQTKCFTGLPIIVRSMIEALSLLGMIATDKKFSKIIYTKYFLQRAISTKSLLKLELQDTDRIKTTEVIQDIARYFNINTEMTEDDSLNIIIKKIKEKLIEISERDSGCYSPTSCIRKFLDLHFEVIYRMYCSHTHSDLMALESRHIIKQGDDFSVIYFKEFTLEECNVFFDAILACIVLSTRMVSSITTLYKNKKLKELERLHRRFKEKYKFDT